MSLAVLKTFFVAMISFVVFDLLWFRFGVKDFNLRELAEIGRIKDGKFDVLLTPAVLTYVLMALAITVFVVPNLADGDSWLKTYLWGAGMGFIVYGIYDLTNFAILKNYPFKFMLADMAWGTFIFGVVTCLVRLTTKTSS